MQLLFWDFLCQRFFKENFRKYPKSQTYINFQNFQDSFASIRTYQNKAL